MASRDISGTLLRVCFGATRKGVTPSKLLDRVLDEMASAQRDLDKTGDIDSAYYYEGMIDAYNTVAQWIAPFKDQDKYHELLGFQSPIEIAEKLKQAKEAAA